MKDVARARISLFKQEYFVDVCLGNNSWKNYGVFKTRTKANKCIEDLRDFYSISFVEEA